MHFLLDPVLQTRVGQRRVVRVQFVDKQRWGRLQSPEVTTAYDADLPLYFARTLAFVVQPNLVANWGDNGLGIACSKKVRKLQEILYVPCAIRVMYLAYLLWYYLCHLETQHQVAVYSMSYSKLTNVCTCMHIFITSRQTCKKVKPIKMSNFEQLSLQHHTS